MRIFNRTFFAKGEIPDRFKEAETLNNAAADLIISKKYNDAKRKLKKAIKICPEYSLPYCNLGVLSAEIGEKNVAIQNYSKAIEIDPSNIVALMNRALEYTLIKDYDRAVHDYCRVLEIEPTNEKALSFRGNIYFRNLNKDEEGLKDFEDLIKVNPKNADAYFNAGLCYCEKQEYKKGKELIEQAGSLGMPNPKDIINKLFCPNCNGSILGKKGIPFKVGQIIKSKIKKGSISNVPSIEGFDIGFSDINKYKPEGNFYFYEVEASIYINIQLCSYKCAYEYAVENNTLMYFDNPEKSGTNCCITPQIVKLNKGLGNKDIYRGQPVNF